MELKLYKSITIYFSITSFNRTFMELKQCCHEVDWTLRLCFNRTFMELKLLTKWGMKMVEDALIGPLWN